MIDATNPLDGLQRVRKRVSGVQYFLEHHYGVFYILTNAPLSENKEQSGGDYYLATFQAEQIQSSDWQVALVLSTNEMFPIIYFHYSLIFHIILSCYRISSFQVKI